MFLSTLVMGVVVDKRLKIRIFTGQLPKKCFVRPNITSLWYIWMKILHSKKNSNVIKSETNLKVVFFRLPHPLPPCYFLTKQCISKQIFLIVYRKSGNTRNQPVKILNVDSKKTAHSLNSIFWHLVQVLVRNCLSLFFCNLTPKKFLEKTENP